MRATDKEIIEMADYILTLAKKIRAAADAKDGGATRKSGTIHNLAPELSKSASEIRKMVRWGYK